MRKVFTCAGVALAVCLSACAHDRARYVRSSGEPLYVDVGEQSFEVAEQVNDGTAVHRDASGNVVGTTEMSHTEMRTMRVKVWRFRQGHAELDELDFFRLAGDERAADELAARRSRGKLINRIGIGLALVGAAGLVGYYAGPADSKQLSATVWAIGLPLGSVSALWGKRMVESRYFPLERAMQAVDAGGTEAASR